MRRQRIAEQWDTFAREVLAPVGAGEIQKKEARRAFYAGAWALYSLQMNQLSPGVERITQDDLNLMADLDAEMREFGELVKAGRA